MRNASLQLAQHEVACAAITGVGFDEIDKGLIAPSACSDAEKDALRLYACSFLSRFELRRMALDRLRDAGHERDDDSQPQLAGWESLGSTKGSVSAESWTA